MALEMSWDEIYDEEDMPRVHCDRCQVLVINGLACHETGCPDSHVDPSTGKGYRHKCCDCGRTFRMKSGRQRRCHVCERRMFAR